MKPDEELTKQQGRPVIKGVMDAGDLGWQDDPKDKQRSFEAEIEAEIGQPSDPNNVEPPEDSLA